MNYNKVYIEEIARALTPNKWFTTREFAALVDMTISSAAARLRALYLKDQLDRRKESHYKIFYRMSAVQKMMMMQESTQGGVGRPTLEQAAEKEVEHIVTKANMFDELLYSKAFTDKKVFKGGCKYGH